MKNILVVDDDKNILQMVDTILTTNNMKAWCISKGANVFDSIDAINPDVILMDIYLGDSDGRELCHDIKTVKRYSHIPVVLYSGGYITDSSILHSLANDFIAKPFSIINLIDKIKALA